MKERLRIDLETLNDSARLMRLTGELDGGSTPILIARWRQERKPGWTLVIHLAGVEFISSSGIGALLAMVEESRERGDDIHLMAPSANVRAVMKLLGLERFLPVLPEGAALPGRKAA